MTFTIPCFEPYLKPAWITFNCQGRQSRSHDFRLMRSRDNNTYIKELFVCNRILDFLPNRSETVLIGGHTSSAYSPQELPMVEYLAPSGSCCAPITATLVMDSTLTLDNNNIFDWISNNNEIQIRSKSAALLQLKSSLQQRFTTRQKRKLQRCKLVRLSWSQASWRCRLHLSLSSCQRPALERRARHLYQQPISSYRWWNTVW